MSNALDFELTDSDRKHLRDMMRGAGFGVAMRIWQAYLDAAIDTAQRASRQDPLTNAQELARKWAYVGILEQALLSLKSGIAFELNLLNDKEAPPASPAEVAERRRRLVLGFLDPLPGSPGEAKRANEMGVPE
jgi:hypothetical protein